MERAIQQIRLILASTRPWVTVAVIIAAGFFLHFAAQGALWWQATGDNASLRDEISRLERSTGQLPDGANQQEAILETKTAQLDSLLQLFEYPATDTLMAIVSATAANAGLDLASMTAEDVVYEPVGNLRYRVRPISVVMDGPTANVRNFLSILYDLVPVVVASNARIVNLDSTPSTQIQLRFYLSPESIPENDEDSPG